MQELGSLRSSNAGRERLLTWLNATYTDEELGKAQSSRTPGTCEWIFGRSEYRHWTNAATSSNSMSILWIHGPPGFGKSVLSASIVERLQSENPRGVAHFFCDAKRQPLEIVRSWVAQMVSQNEQALEAAEEAYHGKEGRLATTYDIWQLFKTICKQIPRCFFVVDGFDECPKSHHGGSISFFDDRANFLQGLTSISSETPARILLVSREDADVRFQFRRLVESPHSNFFEYGISPVDTQDDIRSFSASIVARNLSTKNGKVKKEIAMAASERCQGMFLWIRLLSNRLNSGKTDTQLREVVSQMPLGFDETYERDLVHIFNLGEDKERAIGILRWTLFATRPLTVRELTEALIVDVSSEKNTYPWDDLPEKWGQEDVNDQIRRLVDHS